MGFIGLVIISILLITFMHEEEQGLEQKKQAWKDYDENKKNGYLP